MKSQYRKGHYQRSVACDLAAHTVRPLEVTEKPLGRRPRAVSVRRWVGTGAG